MQLVYRIVRMDCLFEGPKWNMFPPPENQTLNLRFLRRPRSFFWKKSLATLLIVLSLASISTAQDKSQSASKAERFSGKLNGAPLKITWDFGYVPIDYIMIYTVPLENVGQDSLRILSVKSSCECTRPKVTTRIVAPGEATPLIISYNTKNFYGPQSRFVEVRTSDPYAPERIVQFQAVVGGQPAGVDMRPRSVFNLPGSNIDTVKIRNTTERELNFTVVYQDTSLFRITAVQWSVPVNGYGEVYVIPRLDLAKGIHFSTFTLEFDTEPLARMSTPVKIVRY